MDPYIEVRCNFGEHETIFHIRNPTSFNVFSDVVHSMFPEIASSAFSATYAISGHPPHPLNNDNDMEYMSAALILVDSNIVDVSISCPEVEALPTLDTVHTIDKPLQEAPDYETSDPIEGKALLSNEWGGYISHVDQLFTGGAEDFRRKVKLYATEIGFQAKFKKNERGRVTAVCAKKESENCDWNVHAIKCRYNGSFRIKKLNNEHTCIGRLQGKRNKMMTSKVVASIISDSVRKCPRISGKEIMKTFKESYGVELPYWNAWYGREVSRSEFFGDDEKSYKVLFRYVNQLMETNPGSLCSLQVDNNTHRFQRLFIALGGTIKGFAWCRPLLCLDATFLKHKFKGTLLAATAMNGNRGIYPLCYAVVDSENSDNWAWFVEKLAEILNPQGRTVTFISDRNQGLLDAVKRTFPMSPHAYCLFHLKNNIRARFPGSQLHDKRQRVIDIFNKCAYVCKPYSFHKYIQELIAEGKDTIENFLSTLPPIHWANAYFPGQRYGELCSNISESFNSWIIEERHLPITQLVDGVRVRMMRFIGERQANANRWKSVLCPEWEKILLELNKKSRHWLVRQAGEFLFEVSDRRTMSVNLAERTCSCEKWRVNGFICVHAVAVLRQIDGNVYDYIDPYLRVDVFRKLYSFPIYPVPSLEDDLMFQPDEICPLPPITKKQPGRPRNSRFKSIGEVPEALRKCGRCKQLGRHNRRSCNVVI